MAKELTPRKMELALLEIGYDESDVETWTDSKIERVYLEEFEDFNED